jgi:hypothetical protein
MAGALAGPGESNTFKRVAAINRQIIAARLVAVQNSFVVMVAPWESEGRTWNLELGT